MGKQRKTRSGSGNGAHGVAGKLQTNNSPPAKRATKRTLKVEGDKAVDVDVAAEPVVDESKMGQSPSAVRQRKQRSRNVPPQLRGKGFKPGQSGNPSGRPKGSISLTSKLRKLLAQPAYNGSTEKTKGDLVVEMALHASLQGDAAFFKEIINRIDGKVSDHVVIETAQKLVDQEINRVAAAVVEITIELCDEFIPDTEKASEFAHAMGERLVEVLATPTNTKEARLALDFTPEGEGDD